MLARKYHANADTGSTGHYMSLSSGSPLLNIRKTSHPIHVYMPNGNLMVSTHIAELDLPTVPSPARTVHIFPDMEGSLPLLSIGKLCDEGCIAIYEKDTVNILMDNKTILQGKRDFSTGLWFIDLNKDNQPTRQFASASTIIHNDINTAQRVAFFHAALGSPTPSTLTDAMDRGFINIPAFTKAMFVRNLPKLIATSKGHLDRTRQGIRSTHPSAHPTIQTETKEEMLPSTASRTKTHIITVKLLNSDQITGQNYNDMTGRFPVASVTGKNYILLMYNVDANYIHVEPMIDRSGPQYRAAYERGYEYFNDRGCPVVFEYMDNEVPLTVLNFCRDKNITIQLVPPDNHRANRAERAIRTFKNHAIASLSSAAPDFPLEAWDFTLPQIELTLNLMRASHVNPYISAWQQLNGPYNFLETPIAPIGTRVMVYIPPDKRGSWVPHSKKGWYVGPSLVHYRCFRVYMEQTKAIRVSDSIQWASDPINLPGSSPLEILSAAINDLAHALEQTDDIHPALHDQRQPVSQLKERLMPALLNARAIFANPPSRIPPPPGLQHPTPSPALQTDTILLQPNHGPASTAPTRNSSIPSPAHLPTIPTRTEDRQTRTAPDIPFQRIAEDTPAQRVEDAPVQRVEDAPVQRVEQTNHPQRIETPSAPITRSLRLASKPRLRYDTLGMNTASSALESVTAPRNYRAALNSEDKEKWLQASAEEIDRLVTTWDCIEFIPYEKKPKNKKASYYNPQIKLKMKEGELVYRVRGTYGGNHTEYYGETAAKTAALPTVKILLNAVISDKDSKWKTADIKNFYLTNHHRLKDPEYMFIKLDQLPTATIAKYNLQKIQRNGAVMTKVKSALYGLPQAGKISQDHLILLLYQHGYHQSKTTPCLFMHETRDIQFVLVVDDFGIKYKKDEDFEHLLNTLKLQYQLTVDDLGSKYLGMDINHDKNNNTITIAMHNYIHKALELFQAQELTTAGSPMTYTPPIYGLKTQPQELIDETNLIGPERKRRIQQIVGKLLYYARAVDPTMITAINKVASQQAKPTEEVEVQSIRLLQYAKKYPNAHITYFPSDMQLIVHSDASHLSETLSRSRAGGHFYLGNRDNKDKVVNGSIHNRSSIIPSIMGSAAEAEYAAIYLNCIEAEGIRETLKELKFQQDPTLIISDNSCAVGVSNDTVKQKRSKGFAMRFHWIKERVKLKHFTVQWEPGQTNLADLYTKALPVHKHEAIRKFYVQDNP